MDTGKLENLDLLVKDNIRILTLPEKKLARPVAIILVGPPFSGKSTLASYLAKQFPLALLSDENMASFLAPRATFFQRGSEEIFILATKTIEELMRQKVSVIYDTSIKKRSDRELIRQLVTKAGGRLVLIHLTMTQEEAFIRLTQINSQIVRGDRKGFIMDKDLFGYELNSIEVPTGKENPIVFNATEAGTKEKVESQIRAIVKS